MGDAREKASILKTLADHFVLPDILRLDKTLKESVLRPSDPESGCGRAPSTIFRSLGAHRGTNVELGPPKLLRAFFFISKSQPFQSSCSLN